MSKEHLIYKSFCLYKIVNLFFNKFELLVIKKDAIILKDKHKFLRIKLNNIESYELKKKILFNNLLLTTKNTTFSISALDKFKTRKITRILDYLKNYELIKQDFALYDDILEHRKYISKTEGNNLYTRIKNSLIFDLKIFYFNELKKEYNKYLKYFKVYLKAPEKIRLENNEIFVKQELIAFKEFFDTVESQPLTEQQRKAIIINEDNNLIVAGAGSGKTSVVVAKVIYLIQKKLVKPEELLVLAYNTKAKDELEERLSEKLKSLPVIMTFHGLGNHILRVGNTKKLLSKIATDDFCFKSLLRKIIAENLINNSFSEILQEYFQEFFYPIPNIFQFKDEGEYWDYLESYEVRTLNNEKVKSIEECIIANFLFINGIKYTYEKPYKIETQTIDREQYTPDFYLEDYDIYIEHFAIDSNEKTPPFIDNEKYLKGIKWKRGIHQLNETQLIETYSYEKYRGILLKNLRKKLAEQDVKFEPIDIELLYEKLNQSNYIDSFTELLGTFLNHYKSNQLTLENVRNKIDILIAEDKKESKLEVEDSIKRMNAFVMLFEPIYKAYEHILKKNNEIDFNDMIQMATKYHNLGLYESPFKYILVDEFQDISQGRSLLLKELLKETEQVKLCCVGDDWQSIYRFSGSDILIMQNFNKIFGTTVRTDLDMTFRFDNQINDVATKFITKNSSQLKKEINTVKHNTTPSVLIYYTDGVNDAVIDVLCEIEQNLRAADKNNVLLLSRFNKLKQKPKENEVPFKQILEGYQKRFEKLNIKFSSVHGSKGLGFDYVIVIDMNRGAFPLEKIDDPILGLVLPEKENFSHAEERRLFYVALTRAKEKVYLIPSARPSCFISELEDEGYNVGTYGTNDNPQKIHCPKCKTGILIKSSTQKSFICSHTLYCDFLIPICNHCNKGFAIHNPKTNKIECFACNDEKQKCPECDGFLVERKSEYGSFYGCSNYPKCNYTKNIKSNKKFMDKYKNFKNYKE